MSHHPVSVLTVRLMSAFFPEPTLEKSQKPNGRTNSRDILESRKTLVVPTLVVLRTWVVCNSKHIKKCLEVLCVTYAYKRQVAGGRHEGISH